MCLKNEKNPVKEYKYAWKVFLEYDNKLHSPVQGRFDEYSEGTKYTTGYGYHGFINKKGAVSFIDILKIIYGRAKIFKMPKGAKFVVKKVKIDNVAKEGFTPNTGKTYVDVFKNAIAGQVPNSLRFSVMTIQGVKNGSK